MMERFEELGAPAETRGTRWKMNQTGWIPKPDGNEPDRLDPVPPDNQMEMNQMINEAVAKLNNQRLQSRIM